MPFRGASEVSEPLACVTFDLDTLGQDLYDAPLAAEQKQRLEAASYAQVLARILDFLRALDVRATFFVIGRHVECHAAALRELVRQGHEVANHTMTHPRDFAALPREAITKEIEDCHAVVVRALGCEP